MANMKYYFCKSSMIRKKILLFAYICILIISLSSISLNLGEVNNNSNGENRLEKENISEYYLLNSDYTQVEPINISSSDDWDKYDFISGNGSDTDPYIIENIEIEGSGVNPKEEHGHNRLNYSDAGIFIDAEGNFTIRNCKVSNISIGIYLGFYLSTGYNHSIYNIVIDNCGIGIFGFLGGSAVNISNCNISNCNWVTVDTPQDLGFDNHYGGYGIQLWTHTQISIIENNHIDNCSIGLLTGHATALIGNQLTNCGFWFDFAYILQYNAIINNTINGKPLGLIFGEDNLSMSAQEISQYGQLIFIFCKNLQLKNIRINDPSSVGIALINCDQAVLENIITENQKISFFFDGSYYIKANNLVAKKSDVGFLLSRASHSSLRKLFTENTDIPFCVKIPIINSTIEIEKDIPLYLYNIFDYDTLELNTSDSSLIIYPSFINKLDFECFLIEINETNTYHVTVPDYEPSEIDFTIVIYQPSSILGFPILWIYLLFLVSIVSLIILFHRKYK
ncbi:MAG: hypothetical protein EU543_05510 [Promethearchaeota archaeon]|nr:MAG: hypothetical protein EU543_05510 [Candidatus Lokiarchaeota archaeon]